MDTAFFDAEQHRQHEAYLKDLDEQQLRDEYLLEAMSQILATKAGRFFISWLFKRTSAFAHDYTLGAQIYRNSQERNIGMDIFHLVVAVAPHMLAKLVTASPETTEKKEE